MAELKKILYAEDEADIQSIAQMALEMMGGYQLKLCSNGQEAVDEVVAYQPDLILLDVMMPHLDGPGALKQIRAKPEVANIPIIFMTAKVQGSEIDELMALGATAVISKPFDPMNLPEQVKNLWEASLG